MTHMGQPKLWHTAVTKGRRELCHQAVGINPPIHCHTHLVADGSSSSRMHSSSNPLLRILDTKQVGTKHTFFGNRMLLHVRAYHHACIHHCHAISACRLCIDYIQQQCVCVFVPLIFATSTSDHVVSLCSVFRGLYT